MEPPGASCPLELHSDTLDIKLIHTLEAAYTVVVAQQESKIIYQLYEK